MTEVTQILNQIGDGDSGAADQLFPLVYDELRKVAATRLVGERPGDSLAATDASLANLFAAFADGIQKTAQHPPYDGLPL